MSILKKVFALILNSMIFLVIKITFIAEALEKH
jgi:hypothetical protein